MGSPRYVQHLWRPNFEESQIKHGNEDRRQRMASQKQGRLAVYTLA
jgi:hypothetical protein